MVYAFIMKLLFKFRQKSRKEMQEDALRDDSGQKVSKDKRPYKLPLDIWQQIDLVSAVSIFFLYGYLAEAPVETFLEENKSKKDWYDAAAICLSTASFLRVCSFLTVNKEMSELILTLKAMLVETTPFIILLWLYIIAMALIYTTLFQDINQGLFGTFIDSLITMFDGVNAAYTYQGFGFDWEMGHMWLIILHVYMGNIVMLNYLIAILS